jgi:hypothetical protein
MHKCMNQNTKKITAPIPLSPAYKGKGGPTKELQLMIACITLDRSAGRLIPLWRNFGVERI